jgi:hypothetical protein
LSLTPTGTISGIITDSSGRLLANATVQAVRAAYQNGQRTLTVMKSVRTDDLGAYRLFWLTPGSYYVNVVVPGNRDYQSSGLVANPNSVTPAGRGFLVWDDPLIQSRPFDSLVDESEAYVPIYFPSTADLAAATIVDVPAEGDVVGVNITAVKVRTARLRGVSSDALKRQPVAAQVALLSTDPSAPNNYAVSSDGSTGAFNFAKVIPGAYLLLARTNTGSFGSTLIDFREGDAKEVSLPLSPGVNIPGTIRFENSSIATDISAIGVGMLRFPLIQGQATLTIGTIGAGGTRQSIGAPASTTRNVSRDGSFSLADVPAGDYRVFVNPIMLPQGPPGSQPPAIPAVLQNAFVKSIQLNGADALDGIVSIGQQVEGKLEIVLSTNPGTVEGRAMTVTGQPASGSTVVLMPDITRRFRTEIYQAAMANADGQFRLEGVPPGNYKLFAWEIIEPQAWQNSDLMRRFEVSGRSITVTEGATTKVDMQAIAPAP